jgi:hypothetical protein
MRKFDWWDERMWRFWTLLLLLLLYWRGDNRRFAIQSTIRRRLRDIGDLAGVKSILYDQLRRAGWNFGLGVGF